MISMNTPFYTLVLLHLVLKANCVENNVCPTIEDYYTIKNNSNCWYDFAADHNVGEIIALHGYPVETHKVLTEDGYILTMFRIPRYDTNNVISKQTPVFLQHGYMSSSIQYVIRGRDSLAFVLADAGYDVWLGNSRGTQYGEEHVNLTVHDQQFWDYSLDDLALYDIPAELEFIGSKTGQKGNIVYIGHSLGTIEALVYSSALPQQSKNTVKLFILLAPVLKLGNTKALAIKILRPLADTILRLVNDKHLTRIISQAETVKKLTQLFCLESPDLMQRCFRLLNLLIQGPQQQTDAKSLPVILKHLPSGIALKVGKQMADFYLYNYFGMYNYGHKNIEKYGSTFPPKYDLRKIKVPIFLMYAVGDWIATKQDVLILYKKLPPKARYGIYEISVPNFNHGDFASGRNAKSIVYDPILRLLTQVNLVYY